MKILVVAINAALSAANAAFIFCDDGSVSSMNLAAAVFCGLMCIATSND